MDVTIRKEKYLIDIESGLTFTCIKNSYSKMHSHDFFEVCLIISGEICHILNGKEQHLSEGYVILIKPGDVHCFYKPQEHSLTMINFMISKKIFSNLIDYLCIGSYLLEKNILGKITDDEKISFFFSEYDLIAKLPKYKEQEIYLKAKQLLSDILISVLLQNLALSNNPPPLWFDTMLCEMNKKENYNVGVQKMYEISKKSPEYISRLFRKHINMTPTEYINAVRLENVRMLLTNTDMNILDICYEAGFNSLSNFYKAFEQFFGFPPGYFRKDIGVKKKR